MSRLYITAIGLSDTPGDLPCEEQVTLCLAWLKEFSRPARGWSKRSSYGLKHTVENWSGQYIANGAFIEAVKRLGYGFRRCSYGSPNAEFRMMVNRNVSNPPKMARTEGTDD